MCWRRRGGGRKHYNWRECKTKTTPRLCNAEGWMCVQRQIHENFFSVLFIFHFKKANNTKTLTHQEIKLCWWPHLNRAWMDKSIGFLISKVFLGYSEKCSYA